MASLDPALGRRRVTALGSTYRMLTDGADVSGAYAAIEEQFWGEVTPLHIHHDAEEVFYILGGLTAPMRLTRRRSCYCSLMVSCIPSSGWYVQRAVNEPHSSVCCPSSARV